MPTYTIETEYQLPVYRHRNIEAPTIEAACEQALDDDEWGDAKHSYDGCGPTYVSGAWEGANNAYGTAALPIPEGVGDELANPKWAEAVKAIEGVLDWCDQTGGWDAPCWDELRRVIGRATEAEADDEHPKVKGLGPIAVHYSSLDGVSQITRFATVEEAREFSHLMIGAHPEMGRSYAVSGDGVGKVTVTGCTLADLFPSTTEPT